MKSVLISIRPKWCAPIASRIKKVEVRKTKPKLLTPFKAYIYCTANKNGVNDLLEIHGTDGKIRKANAKVIGEFVCDRIEEIGFSPYMHGMYICPKDDSFIEQSCVSFDEMFDYLGEEYGYGWHITDLVIYDEPKELSEFSASDNEAVQKCKHRVQSYFDGYCHSGYLKCGFYCSKNDDWCDKCKTKPITRPPQSWCYVEEGSER